MKTAKHYYTLLTEPVFEWKMYCACENTEKFFESIEIL